MEVVLLFLVRSAVNLDDGAVQDNGLPHSHAGMDHNVLTDRDIWTKLQTQTTALCKRAVIFSAVSDSYPHHYHYFGSEEPMNHTVDTCSLTKFEGELNLLHEADDDAVIRLESTVTAALVK